MTEVERGECVPGVGDTVALSPGVPSLGEEEDMPVKNYMTLAVSVRSWI